MKKTVFVTHINQSIPEVTVTSCQCVVGHGWNVVTCCDPAFDRVVSSPSSLPYYPGELLPIMDYTAREAPTETFFGFRSIK